MLEEMGSVIHIKNLSDHDYAQCLHQKLIEEVAEVTSASSKEEKTEEIADVLEALDAICHFHGIHKEDLEKCKHRKRLEKGGFYERKFVTIAEHQPDSMGEKYCLERPEKYPEVT